MTNKIQEEDGLVYTNYVTTDRSGNIIIYKNTKILVSVGMFIIGTDHQPICVPGKGNH